MILILAEKKEVAEALSAALPGTASARTSYDRIEQDNFLITWLGGHIMQLKDPEDYNYSLYKNWSIEQLPINFENWGNKPSAVESKQKKLVKIGQWLRTCESVIHAGDPDQEGQLLVDEVLREFDYKGKVMRINTSDTTVAGLQDAFANMTDNTHHVSGGLAAYARSVADFMIGINMSRLFTKLNNGILLTIGRVQTPTLQLVYERDMQVENHKKTQYFTISATVVLSTGQEIKVTYTPAKDSPELIDGRLTDPEIAKAKIKMLQKMRNISNIGIDKKIEYENPPLPFDMTELQTYCETAFNMKPDVAMAATQTLRDKHHAITYNRSSCRYLTDNHYNLAPETMKTVIKNINFSPKGMDMTIKSEAFNNELVGEHHGIIPQNKQINLNDLSDTERKVYLAIVKYFMAQFMPAAKKEITHITIPTPDGGILKASSTVILEPGYRSIFKEAKKDEESTLSMIAAGTYCGDVTAPISTAKKTKPPVKYTKAKLLKEMTVISKHCEDKRIQQLLREKDKHSKEDNGSIGTVATRTKIVDNLIEKRFLIDDGKYLTTSELGRELLRILPDELKKVDMTAEWWLICEHIKEGTATPKDLQDDVLNTIIRILDHKNKYPKIDANVIAKSKTYGGKVPVGACPRCRSPIIEGNKGFGCLGWKKGCKFVIWKKPNGSIFRDFEVTPEIASQLLSGEWVRVKNLYSKNKEAAGEKDPSFPGYIYIDDSKLSDYGPELKVSLKPKPKGRSGPVERGGPAERGGKDHKAKSHGSKSRSKKQTKKEDETDNTPGSGAEAQEEALVS